jgi:hypothetical protein
MNSELDLIPLKSVPYKVNKDTKEKKLISVDVENEKGVPAGKFGWCITCRGRSDLYCRETRHPVCS